MVVIRRSLNEATPGQFLWLSGIGDNRFSAVFVLFHIFITLHHSPRIGVFAASHSPHKQLHEGCSQFNRSMPCSASIRTCIFWIYMSNCIHFEIIILSRFLEFSPTLFNLHPHAHTFSSSGMSLIYFLCRSRIINLFSSAFTADILLYLYFFVRSLACYCLCCLLFRWNKCFIFKIEKPRLIICFFRMCAKSVWQKGKTSSFSLCSSSSASFFSASRLLVSCFSVHYLLHSFSAAVPQS